MFNTHWLGCGVYTIYARTQQSNLRRYTNIFKKVNDRGQMFQDLTAWLLIASKEGL